MTFSWTTAETRLGAFTLVARDGHVVRILLPGDGLEKWADAARADPAKSGTAGDAALLNQAAAQVREYVEGRRDSLTFPVRFEGTEFQEAVWNALRGIPRGEVRTYGEVAAAVGRPGAARAVGQANHANPLPLVVPCHRVVASDGSLGGYAGRWNEEGGMKETLLRLEGADLRVVRARAAP